MQSLTSGLQAKVGNAVPELGRHLKTSISDAKAPPEDLPSKAQKFPLAPMFPWTCAQSDQPQTSAAHLKRRINHHHIIY